MPNSPVAAAQYLRMSTEHQRYSLQNQIDAIQAYAEGSGMEIVRTYTDAGKSGLTLRGRDGLKQMIADTLAPDRPFAAILVLDVSRWGRFQDPDQSAHYEFICREAGVRVEYCAEPFDNDGTAIATILKHLKRVMAGEYSRELSEKITRAHRQQAQLGYRQGGSVAYGIRRLVVGADGAPRFYLAPGERKALNTDRVIPVRGSADETTVIQAIFRLYTECGLSMAAISRLLNADAIPASHGGTWNHRRVRSVLASEFAIGNQVYSRTSRPMRATRHQPNPPEKWVRVPVMDPVVDEETFARAAERLGRKKRYRGTDEALLEVLGRLLREEGHLSRKIINRCPYVPNYPAVQARFGTLRGAYALLGYSTHFRRWCGPDLRVADDGELLQLLAHLHRRAGYLTADLINADPNTPSASVYKLRFGTVRKACALAGFPRSRPELIADAAARKRSALEALSTGARRE